MNSTQAVFSAVVLALLGAAFVGGVYVGEARAPAVEEVVGVSNVNGDALTAQVAAAGGGESIDFMPYWRVWNTLEKKFIPHGTSTDATSTAPSDRLYRSIEGLVASYNDPYTVFMRPQVSEDFKIATKGSLEGIGAVIGERDGKLVVVGPLDGSPAKKAGLVSGDHILEVDGKSMDGVPVDAAVEKIRGQGGTTVVLKILSEGKDPRDVAIVRGTIEIPSTAHAVIAREVPKVTPASTAATASTTGSTTAPSTPVETVKRDFYVLRLFSFSQTSINSFERELNDYVKSGATTLIIDLRGNPGGYIESAVQIASWFLPEGSVVVREMTGPKKIETVHRTTKRELFKKGVPKIAILVDKGSASAAEILAGALQEHGVAKLVGTRTFGKGSVQELVSITDQLSLKVTVARWYTPNGVSISDGGLTPDIAIDPTTATSSDPWVDAAVGYLSE
jgi:carboxyl-terminal processing protease